VAAQHSAGAAASVHAAALTFAEAADYLGLSQAALLRAVERGDLPRAPGPVADRRFATDDLERFLDEQRDRAALTGKLTMPLQISIDVPALLSAMVRMRDEREAAESLATSLSAFAGARCPAVAILRIDEVLQTMRLLGLSDFPGRERLPYEACGAYGAPGTSAARDDPLEVDTTTLQGPLRAAVVDARPVDTREVEPLLAPVLGTGARELCQLLSLQGAIVYPLLRIGSVRWVIVLLLACDPLELRPEKRDAIEALGIQASIALEAVRLRVDVLHRANRAEALYGTARMLARSEDSASLLERISALAARLLATDAAVVLVYDESRQEFCPGAGTGLDPDALTRTANLSATYLVGRAAGMTQPLQVTDASQATSLHMPRLPGERRALAALCAPIVHRGTLLGAIEVYSARPRSFSADDTGLLSAFAHQAAIAIHAIRTQENRRRALLGAVEALASANEARDGYTGEHCKRLAQLAVLVARRLGFAPDEVERIGLAAALHDIGKIAVPDAILRKPDRLTDVERAIVNRHPTIGEEIVMRVPELHDVASMVGAHQERFDGNGYPRGLAGAGIPIGARIIACVDTYAALIEDRPYRRGATHEQAVEEIQRCAGSQLDPAIVAAFVDLGAQIKQLVSETDELLATRDAVELTQIERPIARAAEAQEQQRHELENLQRAVDLIAGSHDPSALQAIVDSLGAIPRYRHVSIHLVEGPELVLHAQIGRADEQSPRRAPLDHGVAGLVLAQLQPVLIEEAGAVPGLCGQADGASVVAVPIAVDGAVAGVLTVESDHEHSLKQWDLTLVQLFAQQATAALTNSARAAATASRMQMDSLTGLPDQSAFIRQLRAEIDSARCQLQPLSLLFLDLDHFKLANDAFGHRFGDELLTRLGRILPDILPPHAWAARYGGEEFVVILPRTPADQGVAEAEALRAQLDERAFDTPAGHQVRMSASIGVAGFDPESATIVTSEQMIDAADRAMYAAKVQGRNRVVLWSEAVVELLRSRP
jgi:diguanylate cyclase (GGDEF)-like protein